MNKKKKRTVYYKKKKILFAVAASGVDAEHFFRPNVNYTIPAPCPLKKKKIIVALSIKNDDGPQICKSEGKKYIYVNKINDSPAQF